LTAEDAEKSKALTTRALGKIGEKAQRKTGALFL
jgi:hypothetical protein